MSIPKSALSVDRINLAFVIASIGGDDVIAMCDTLLRVMGPNDLVILVTNCTEPPNYGDRLIDPRFLHLHNTVRGASAARNRGLMEVISKYQNDISGLIFPNDKSIYTKKGIATARRFLTDNLDQKKIAVGGWKSPDGTTLLEPRIEYRSDLDLLRGYEPSFIVPISLLNQGLRWNEKLGPGPSTALKSGDGAAFLLSAKYLGAQIVGSRDFTVINVNSCKNLKMRACAIKAFSYGVGYSWYLGSSTPKRKLRIFWLICYSGAPFIHYILRKPYWSDCGFVWTVFATTGRLAGLIIPRIRQDYI